MQVVFDKRATVVKKVYGKRGAVYTYGGVVVNLPKEYIGRKARVLVIIDLDDVNAQKEGVEHE